LARQPTNLQRALEYPLEHLAAKPPSIRVLPRAMIGGKEHAPVGSDRFRTVRELGFRPQAKGFCGSDVGDLAKCDHHPNVGQIHQRSFEVVTAGPDLLRSGFVRRRKTFDGIEDDYPLQPQLVGCFAAVAPSRQTEPEQCRVENLA